MEGKAVLKLVDMNVIAKYVYEEYYTEKGKKITHSYSSNKPIQLFEGMFGLIEHKNNIDSHIRIHTSNREFNQSPKKVSMDSIEFEKYFNVLSDDKVVAARIVTSDIMEVLLDFYKKHYLEFEIILYKEKIYMRFFTGPMYEPGIFGKSLSKECLAAYYVLLKFIIDLSKEIDKTMKNFEY